jgi:DNA-binding transcriptional MerR regulator
MGLIDIVEVGRRSGLPASTLRYYEQLGLIESLGRRGLRRTFDTHVLDRLSLIALGRSAGLSLAEIGGMLGTDGEVRIDRELLAAKADEIDRAIQRMQALSDGLRHAANCPAPSHDECPSFRRLRKVALGRMRHERSQHR